MTPRESSQLTRIDRLDTNHKPRTENPIPSRIRAGKDRCRRKGQASRRYGGHNRRAGPEGEQALVPRGGPRGVGGGAAEGEAEQSGRVEGGAGSAAEARQAQEAGADGSCGRGGAQQTGPMSAAERPEAA
jgi:hypothetical protein